MCLHLVVKQRVCRVLCLSLCLCVHCVHPTQVCVCARVCAVIFLTGLLKNNLVLDWFVCIMPYIALWL